LPLVAKSPNITRFGRPRTKVDHGSRAIAIVWLLYPRGKCGSQKCIYKGSGWRSGVEVNSWSIYVFNLLCSPTPARVTCLDCLMGSFVATLLYALGTVQCTQMQTVRIFRIWNLRNCELLNICRAKYQVHTACGRQFCMLWGLQERNLCLQIGNLGVEKDKASLQGEIRQYQSNLIWAGQMEISL
jgi:hypothetical protein